MPRWRMFWAVVLVGLTVASCKGQKSERAGPASSGTASKGNSSDSASSSDSATATANHSNNATAKNATARDPTNSPRMPANTTAGSTASPSTGTSACPASLLPYLQQQRQQAQVDGNDTSSLSPPIPGNANRSKKQSADTQSQVTPSSKLQPPDAVPPWPPVVIKQGLTCTMEVSHLAAALPGSKDVCNIILIRNNLLSVLYSWQLMWDSGTEPGFEAVAADGDVLITSSGTGPGGIVRVVNGAQSPDVDAQGGQATFVLQTMLSSSNSNSSSRANNTGAPDIGRAAYVTPAMGSVYLNGLQCTRLPLMTAEDGSQPQDCAATHWDLDSTRMFMLPPGWNASASYSSFTYANNGSTYFHTGNGSSNDSSSSNLTNDVLAALQWLSCTSHYCCGLQVVPPGSEQTPPASAPAVGALDGPGERPNPAAASTYAKDANATTSSNSSLQATAASLDGAEAEPSSSLGPQAHQLPAGQEDHLQQHDPRSSQINTKTIAAVVASLVGLAVISTAAVVLYAHQRRQRQRQQQRLRLQQLMQPKDSTVPNLATAALIRGSSNASTESSGSLPGVTSSSSGQGSNSLVSLSSAASWQQPAVGRPPVWLRQHPSGLQATATGGVWRAGSWQGADTAQFLGSSPPGGRLLRSTSSPQPILQQQHSLEQTTLNIEALEQTQSSLAASAGAPAAPSLLPKHRRHTSNPNTLMRASSLASGIRHSTAAAQATGPAAEVMAHAAVDGPLPGSASGAGGAQDSATASASSAGTSWSSLRQLFGSSRAPRGSAASAGSSTTLGRSGSMQAAASSAGASNASTAAQQLEHIQVMLHSRQQLQLIQEAAPLAPSQPPMSTAANPPSHLRRHASEPAASFLVGGAAASRAQSAGPSVLHGGPPAQLQAGTAGGGTADGAVISRRISPIVSVFEDTSSATSGDSFTPAAWHHADRQLLEEQPGWLNIDFAHEVRLERKLGEGGFGQVFRARWHDDLIAVKLVPFMSLVTHHNLSVALVSAAEPGAAQSTGAAAGSGNALGQPGTAAADLMGVSMQFSAAALRAIKMEIRVLSQLSHKNIVAFKGACLAPPHICILEELAEGGSLHARLYSRSSCRRLLGLAASAPGQPATTSSSSGNVRPEAGSSKFKVADESRPAAVGKAGRSSNSRGQLPPPMSVSEVLCVAVDVASAMQYLHALKPQVVHRDLKPQNVLLDLQGRAKVCDFGISKMKDASLAASSTRLQAGTPAFMAPEQFEGRPVTDKVDVFAFGVMLWECFEQQQPWRDLTPMQIIYAVGLQKERLGRPASCPDNLWQLIEACWHQQPEMRPAFQEILPALNAMQQELHMKDARHHHLHVAVPQSIGEPPGLDARPSGTWQVDDGPISMSTEQKACLIAPEQRQHPAVGKCTAVETAVDAAQSADADGDDADARVSVSCNEF